MVRRRLDVLSVAAASMLILSPWPAGAQTAEWRAAGGDLFGANTPFEPLDDRTDEAVRLPELDPPFHEAMRQAAARHNIDLKLLQALVLTESGFRPDAVSPAGAAGLTQLMPGTARDLGVVDRFNPIENLLGGANYLAQQLTQFQDVRLALAAYNSGPGRVARLGRVPRIPETEQYVSTVIECFLALTAGRDVRSSRACSRAEGQP